MNETVQAALLTAEEAARQATALTTPSGVRYATLGRLDGAGTSSADLARLVGAVPAAMAAGLQQHVYLFVPLALSGARLHGEEAAHLTNTDQTLIARDYRADLAEKAICHRNASIGEREYVFLSSRLQNDAFALSFEFCINVAHNFVDTTGVPTAFSELVWKQVTANVRGETSVDAWEERAEALRLAVPPAGKHLPAVVVRPGSFDEKARSAYEASAFADALAIYLLSLAVDFDYVDLRERDYPLLSAPALAERLQAVNRLFPANAGYQFQILYRRRT